MNKIILFLVLGLTLILPQDAPAICLNGFYISGSGAANFKQDVKIHSARLKYKDGFFLAAAVGYKWKCLRFETEFGYRHNIYNHLKVDKFKLVLSGNMHTWSYMANALYDVNFENCLDLQPYFGVGIGYSKTKIKRRTHIGRFFGHDQGFAWQAIAGINCPVNEQIDIAFEYRYFHTGLKKDRNHNVGTTLRHWF